MDFWGAVVVMFRRWYVTLLAFSVALGGATYIYSQVDTSYSSTGSLVLSTPYPPQMVGSEPLTRPRAKRDKTNPLLNFDRGLNLTAAIVVNALEDPTTVASLGVKPGGNPSYVVNNGSDNPDQLLETPFVFVTATADSPQAARDLVSRVMDSASKILADRQKGFGKDVPTDSYINMSVVVPPTEPQPERGRKFRGAVVALLLGSFAAVTAAFAFESMAQARAARRKFKAAAAAGS